MSDVFFDLGKHLRQLNSTEMLAHLQKETAIYEVAFVPYAEFGAGAAQRVLRDKTFDRVRFYAVTFKGLIFKNCTFDRCLFLSAKIEDCQFHNCQFINCNTLKIVFKNTYIDPKSFLEKIFDSKNYSNIGVDLFQALLKNSVSESQPQFAVLSEYNFRLWKRYNDAYYWRRKSSMSRWTDYKFFLHWFANVSSMVLTGYGLRARNVFFSSICLILLVGVFNHWQWASFDFDPQKLKDISYLTKLTSFTIGALSNFGTGDLVPRTNFGLNVLACEVILGLGWIAVSTAMLIKRVIR